MANHLTLEHGQGNVQQMVAWMESQGRSQVISASLSMQHHVLHNPQPASSS